MAIYSPHMVFVVEQLTTFFFPCMVQFGAIDGASKSIILQKDAPPSARELCRVE